MSSANFDGGGGGGSTEEEDTTTTEDDTTTESSTDGGTSTTTTFDSGDLDDSNTTDDSTSDTGGSGGTQDDTQFTSGTGETSDTTTETEETNTTDDSTSDTGGGGGTSDDTQFTSGTGDSSSGDGTRTTEETSTEDAGFTEEEEEIVDRIVEQSDVERDEIADVERVTNLSQNPRRREVEEFASQPAMFAPVLTDEALEERARESFFDAPEYRNDPSEFLPQDASASDVGDLSRGALFAEFDEEDFEFTAEDGEVDVSLTDEALGEFQDSQGGDITDQELRERAAEDDPLRDADDFVVDDGEVRRRAAPFFEEQREALGFDTPEESRIRRGLQVASSEFTEAASGDFIDEPVARPPVDTSQIEGVDQEVLETIPEDLNRSSAAASAFNVPGIALDAATTAEQAANLAQAGLETRASGAEDLLTDDGGAEAASRVNEPFTTPGTRAAEEAEVTEQAVRQTAGELRSTAAERPGVVIGAAVGAGVAGAAAGGAIARAPGAARSVSIRARGGRIIDAEDLDQSPVQTGELPGFTQRAQADPDFAVREFERQTRRGRLAEELGDPIAYHGRSPEATREFGGFGREFDAPEGSSEISGLFQSADLSPLRLPGGGGDSGIPRPGLPRPRFRTGRVAAEADPDVRRMPRDVQSLDDASRFMQERADPEASFVRSENLITPEQEVIAPPGARFQGTGELFGVRSGRDVVPGRVYRRQAADADDASVGTAARSESAEDVFMLSDRASRTITRSRRRQDDVTPFTPTAGSSTRVGSDSDITSEVSSRPSRASSSVLESSFSRSFSEPVSSPTSPSSPSGTPSEPSFPSSPYSPSSGSPSTPSSPSSPPSSTPPSAPPSSPPTLPPAGPIGAPDGSAREDEFEGLFGGVQDEELTSFVDPLTGDVVETE